MSFSFHFGGLARRKQKNRVARPGKPASRRSSAFRRQFRLEPLEERRLLNATMEFQHVIFDPVSGQGMAGGMVSTPLGSATPPSTAFTPAQIRKAYGIDQIFDKGVAADGAGMTIAIIDAFDNPKFVSRSATLPLEQDAAYLASDLHKFCLQYGLPEEPGFFTKVNQTGGTTYPSGNQGWGTEIALDVEWVHAIAPGAKIVLVEANSNYDNDLINAAAVWARDHSGAVAISMSFGRNETSSDTTFNSIFQSPADHGVTWLASTGDNGAPSGYPAYSPTVVAVGGTTLTAPGGVYTAEVGWSGSGGSISNYQAQPAYQQGLVIHNGTGTINPNGKRSNPDISFLADPATGVAVYDSYANGTSAPWIQVGGTSFSAPAWAGLVAIVDQIRDNHGLPSLDGASGFLPKLYQTQFSTDYHDITTGANGYSAGVGYDLVTGLGTPRADKLVFDLAGVSYPPKITDTAPLLSGGTLNVGSTSLAVNFNKAGLTGAGDAANYRLQSAGADGLLNTADDTVVPLNVTYSGSTATLNFPALSEDVYRLIVRDAIVDADGNNLDGDNDTYAGGDWVADFVVVVNPSLQFAPAATSSSGGYLPYAMTKGDFNHDGNLDLAVANNSNSTVGIRLGDGNGGFAAATTFSLGTYGPWYGMNTGDFNGDGNLDLVVANNTGSTSSGTGIGVLLGNGKGSFWAPTYFNSGGSTPHDLAVADFNGDGKLDVAVTNRGSNNVGILLGTGSGFSSSTTIATGGNAPQGITAGDFNADGKIDLAVANTSSNNAGLLFGNGNGTFATATVYNTSSTPPSRIAAGDFNGDGNLDLAVSHNVSGKVSLLLNSGNGVFSTAAAYSAGGTYPLNLETADFNGDGKIDLAVTIATASGSVGILLGGSGGFSAATTFGSGGNGSAGIVQGDFNGDGRPDLAIANLNSNNIGVLLNTNNASFIAKFSPHGMPFEIANGNFGAGELIQGANNAFDGFGRLFVGGMPFQPDTPTYSLADNGQTLLTSAGTAAGLVVRRKITVPNTGNEDFARTVNVFTNTTDAPITTTVQIVGNLGSNAKTRVFATSDGTGVVGPNALWIGTDDNLDGSGTPALVHYLRGPGALKPDAVSLLDDDLEWTYTLTIPAGETVELAYFTIVAASQSAAVAAANVLVTPSDFGGQAEAFLTASELQSLVNFVNHNQSPLLTPALPYLGTTDENNSINLPLAGTFINNGTGTTAITDPDSGDAVGGIAITGTSGRGAWSYSLDGTNFLPFGTVNANSSLLLPGAALLRYTPDSANGETATFTYRAWDRSYGAQGMKADTTISGGTTAFSAATDTASFTVTSVNDAPSVTPAQPAMGWTMKDQPLAVSLTGTFINNGSGKTTIADVDNGAEVGGIAIIGFTGLGVWSYSLDGTTFAAIGTPNEAAALLLPKTAILSYTPDGIHEETATIVYRAWDTTSGTPGPFADTMANGGATAFSMATDTASVMVENVPPTITGTSPTLASGTLPADTTSFAITFSEAMLGWTSAANYQLQNAGADGLLGNVDDVLEPLSIAVNGNTVTLTFAALKENVYRLTAFDTLTDLAGNRLDGNGDGLSEGDRSADFVAVSSGSIFSSVTAYSTGNSPDSVVTGDFNGDGKLDLAVTNHSNGTLGVRLGDGHGGFGTVANYSTGDNFPEGICVGDFNGDGKLDLAAANTTGSNNVGILLGNGDGGFGTATTYSTGGSSPEVVTTGDFNGDGYLDLAAANRISSSGSVGILLGNGNGTFGTVATYSTGGSNPQGICLGDFNADGKLDLAVVNNSTDTLAILLGNGNGTFASPVTYTTGAVNPADIAVGDFNSDAKIDLVVAHDSYPGKVSILLGNGNGTFANAVAYGTGSNYAEGITVGDFNDDGKLDVATANRITNGSVGILLGDGNGIFGAAVSYGTGGNYPQDLSTGDFDGDGKTDLVIVNYSSNTVGILLNSFSPVPIILNTPHGLSLDIDLNKATAGQINQGPNNAFDGYGRLFVGGAAFTPSLSSYATADGGQTVVTANGMAAGLAVNRKIAVPNTGNEDFARTVNVFTNPTSSPITTTVRIVGNLGSDRKTMVFGTSDGTGIVGPDCLWVGTDDNVDGSGTPAIVHYIHGPGALKPAAVSVVDDNIEWTYTLTVPAGQTVELAYLTIVASSRAEAVAAADQLVLAGGFGGQAGAFLTPGELASIVNFVNTNLSPVLTPASPQLSGTDEETAITFSLAGTFINNGAGTTTISDADPGDVVGGIALTGTTGRGTWSYSLDGTNFLPMGLISETSSLLLPSTALLRYTPDLMNGETVSFTCRAWDQSFGRPGMKTATANHGDATAFSAASDTATFTVTSRNDAPVLVSASPILPATTQSTPLAAALAGTFLNNGAGTTSITDVDDLAVVGGIAVMNTTGYGRWCYSLDGELFHPMGAIGDASALLLPKTAYIRYTPDGIHGEMATFSYRAWDATAGTAGSYADTSATGGEAALSAALDTASILVNDAPVLTPAAPSMGTTTEDLTITTPFYGIINNGPQTTVIVDGNDEALVGGIALTGTAGRGTWSYSLDGAVFTSVGAVSNASALLLPATARLRYMPDGQNGETATITYRAWDTTVGTAGSKYDASTGGGATAFSTAEDIASLAVTEVNDAPVLTPAAPSLGKTNVKTEILVNLSGTFINNGTGTTGIIDVDNASLVGGIALTGTTGLGVWSYSLDGATFLPVWTVSNGSALLLPATAQLSYLPNGIDSETPTITYRAWDATAGTVGDKIDTTSSGGITAFSAAADTATLTLDYLPPTIVSTTSSLTGGIMPMGNVKLTVQFSEAMLNAGASGPLNYKLQGSGADGLLGTADDSITIPNVLYGGTTAILTLGILSENVYRLTIGDILTDLIGNKLGGNGDGTAGGGYVEDFAVVNCAFLGDYTTFSTGASPPWKFAKGDFNGDGKLDLAVTGSATNTVGVLLGNGNGGFAASSTYNSGGNQPRGIITADFNGDAKLDLAVTNYYNSNLAILLGNGLGGFGSAMTTSTGGTSPQNLAAGDFNGDGKLDLAVTNWGSGNVGILLGNGLGGFGAASTFVPGGGHAHGIVTSDFNADGKLDLAVVNNEQNGTIGIYTGSGGGTFTTAGLLSSGGIFPESIVLGDFNGDTKTDLAVHNNSGQTFEILLGDGNAGFAALPPFSSGGMTPRNIAVDDLNGDGKLDLVVSNYIDRTAGVLFGMGDGNFWPCIGTGASGSYSPDGIAVVTGDFNGDGRVDLAATNSIEIIGFNGPISVLLNVGSPSWLLLNSPQGFPFDIATKGPSAGVLISRSNGAYDYDGRLKINSSFFQPTSLTYATADSGQTVVTASRSYNGLAANRKITVPHSGNLDFARTLDVFTNSTTNPITVNVQIVGNLGSDAATALFATSSGDAALTPDDYWFGTDAGGSGTAVIHCFRSFYGLKPTAVSVVGDNVTWTFSLTVPAGETRELGYYTIQAADRAQAIAQANALMDANGFLETAALGLNAADLAALVNFQFDHAPTDITLSSTTIPENLVGGVIATLATVDPDQGGTYAYAIVDDPTGKFEIEGDVLKLKAGLSFDFESMADPTVTLTLRTTDQPGGLSFEKQITLTVTNLPDPLIVLPSDLPESGTANLTLALDSDGKLHLYQTVDTVATDIVPPRLLAQVSDVTITGRDSLDEILTVDLSGGNPIPAGGVNFHGGNPGTGDGNSLVLKGTAADDYAVFGTTQITLNGSAPITYSNIADFIFDLEGGTNRLAIDHATLDIRQDNAISTGTEVIMNGGILNANGHTLTLGNITLNDNAQANLAAVQNSTTTVASGTLTTGSIVCDSLVIGSPSQAASSASSVSTGVDAKKDAAIAKLPMSVDVHVPSTLTRSIPSQNEIPLSKNDANEAIASDSIIAISTVISTSERPILDSAVVPVVESPEPVEQPIAEPPFAQPLHEKPAARTDKAKFNLTKRFEIERRDSLARQAALVESLNAPVDEAWTADLARPKNHSSVTATKERNVRHLALQSLMSELPQDGMFDLEDAGLFVGKHLRKPPKLAQQALDDFHARLVACD